MKVVIVTLYKGSQPFSDELADNLLQNQIEVDLFDMFDMFTLKFGDSKTKHYHVKNKIAQRIFNLKYLGTIFRIIFYKFYFIKYPMICDHVSIHYALPFYNSFINAFRRNSNSVSVCIWGSDFYRAADKKKDKMHPLFKGCESIIIGNLKMADEFSLYYNDKFKEKIRYVGFGIGKLDLIKSYKTKLDKKVLRKNINLPENKFIITVGYNGIKEQQHLLVLDYLKNIPQELKEAIFIVIPFGYGGDRDYKNQIESRLMHLKIGYIIYDSFMSDEDLVKTRLSTDLVINAQISDASSASIQEHLFSGNVLLAGEWLPYKYFTDKGVKLWTFNYDNFFEKLMMILGNFEIYQAETEYNDEIIFNLSSWQARIDQWISVFKSDL